MITQEFTNNLRLLLGLLIVPNLCNLPKHKQNYKIGKFN